MKKLLLGLFLTFLFMIRVSAEIFYTNYELVESNSTIYQEESDLAKVVVKDAYNNYRKVKNYDGYYELGYAPAKSIRDIYDFKYGIRISKSPNEFNLPQYITNNMYKYNRGRYLDFSNFNAKGVLKLLEVYYDNNLIDYTFLKSDYNFEDALIYDNQFVIDLGTIYDLDKLVIKLEYEDESLSLFSFALDIFETNYGFGTPYAYYSTKFLRNSEKEICYINFINNDEFSEFLTQSTWIKAKDYSTTKSVTYYKNPVTLYNFYTLKYEYLNVYSEEPIDGYLLDYNMHKKLYDYYYRDYIEVNDEINTQNDLENLIISSSASLDDINVAVYYNDVDKTKIVAIINYKEYTFFKKYKLVDEKFISNEEGSIHEIPDENKKKEIESINNDINLNNDNNENKTFEIENINKNNNSETDSKVITKNIKKTIIGNSSVKSSKNVTSILQNAKNKEEYKLFESGVEQNSSALEQSDICENYKKMNYILITTNILFLILLILILCKCFENIHKKLK